MQVEQSKATERLEEKEGFRRLHHHYQMLSPQTVHVARLANAYYFASFHDGQMLEERETLVAPEGPWETAQEIVPYPLD